MYQGTTPFSRDKNISLKNSFSLIGIRTNTLWLGDIPILGEQDGTVKRRMEACGAKKEFKMGDLLDGKGIAIPKPGKIMDGVKAAATGRNMDGYVCLVIREDPSS